MTDPKAYAKHLQWIHDRLAYIHKENQLVDYMHKLREIIEWLENNPTLILQPPGPVILNYQRLRNQFSTVKSQDWDELLSQLSEPAPHGLTATMSSPKPPPSASPTLTAGGSSTPAEVTLSVALEMLESCFSSFSLKATTASGRLSFDYEESRPTPVTESAAALQGEQPVLNEFRESGVPR